MAAKYNTSKCVDFNEGDTVTVRVPLKDRGPCEFLEKLFKVSGSFHKVKTEFGVLRRQLRSDELEKYDEKITASEKDLMCKCKSGCSTNRCKWFKAGIKCTTWRE